MKIAICDDSKVYGLQLESQLKELAAEIETEVSVDVYKNYAMLMLAMKERAYDLLIVETAIKGVSGIEFAKSIRRQGYRGNIIFVSETADGALAGYAAFPIGYMVKPPMKRKIREAFRYAAQTTASRRSIMLNGISGEKVTVAVEDLLYVEVIGTELSLHCRTEVVKCIGSLAETFEKLPPEQFYRSHRSYIVNMSYITSAVKYHFVMENGDHVTIAKNRYAEAKQMLKNYVGD